MDARSRNDVFRYPPRWLVPTLLSLTAFIVSLLIPEISRASSFTSDTVHGLQTVAALLALGFLSVAAVQAVRGYERRQMLLAVQTLKRLRRLDPDEFVRRIADGFVARNYEILSRIAGPDGPGLILRRGQEKVIVFGRRLVGLKTGVASVENLNRAVSSYGAQRGFFATLGEFTPDARAYARGRHLHLLDGLSVLRLLARRGSDSF